MSLLRQRATELSVDVDLERRQAGGGPGLVGERDEIGLRGRVVVAGGPGRDASREDRQPARCEQERKDGREEPSEEGVGGRRGRTHGTVTIGRG